MTNETHKMQTLTLQLHLVHNSHTHFHMGIHATDYNLLHRV